MTDRKIPYIKPIYQNLRDRRALFVAHPFRPCPASIDGSILTGSGRFYVASIAVKTGRGRDIHEAASRLRPIVATVDDDDLRRGI
jgi:hypothetical protein